MKEQAFFVCSFIVLHILQVKLILFRMSEKMSLLRDLQIDFNVKNARELSTIKAVETQSSCVPKALKNCAKRLKFSKEKR